MTGTRRVVLFSCGFVFSIPAVNREARANTTEACVDAYESAQVLRRDGRLRLAREKLVACAQRDCPAVTTVDCTQWLREVESSLPSVVIAARTSSGRDVVDVRVTLDGIRIREGLDGKAVPIDPGVHVLEFERAGSVRVVTELEVREGDKNRLLPIVFEDMTTAALASTRAPAAPTGAAEGSHSLPNSVSPLVLSLGAIGVVSLAVGTFFTVQGISDSESLKSCTPTCPPIRTEDARRELIVGDVGLGVGLATVAVATYLFFRGSARPAAAPPTASGPGGGALRAVSPRGASSSGVSPLGVGLVF